MAAILEFGPFRLDADAGILFRGAEPTPLGQRAVLLLALLVRRAGTPVSKDALIEAAWPAQAIEDSNLTVQIAAVRRTLADASEEAQWIETLPRRGYRYVGPAVTASDPDRASAPSLTLPERPSIAVLPFANLSGGAEQDYFADGMVDDIITGLSRINWLFVIARSSTFTYKDRAVDVKQVGRELGVRYVLEGSVRKTGSTVRITRQLIDASTGMHVWAERYDRQSDDIFGLQDDIAMSVVGAIAPSLRRAEINRVKRKRPDSLDAYDLVLRAQPDVDSGMPEQVTQALVLLERAIALEPPMRWRTAMLRCAIIACSSALVCRRRAAQTRSDMRVRPLPTGRMMRLPSRWRAFRSAWMATIAPRHSPHSMPRSRSAHHRR